METSTYVFKNIDVSIANALRRTMISNVPTVAIDVIKVKENNGILPDEILAHRLGLIPIKRKNKYTTTGRLILNVENEVETSVEQGGIKTIYSGDLKSDNDDIVIIDKDIIITKLDKGHKIELIAEIAEGTGYLHAKWNPTCGLAYKIEDDGNITMNIETLGTMDPKEVLIESIDILINKFKNLI
jgi:DNA-directed RNA polymerase subunit D